MELVIVFLERLIWKWHYKRTLDSLLLMARVALKFYIFFYYINWSLFFSHFNSLLKKCEAFFFPWGNLSTYPYFLETFEWLEKNVGMWVSCPLAVFATSKNCKCQLVGTYRKYHLCITNDIFCRDITMLLTSFLLASEKTKRKEKTSPEKKK